MRIIIDIRSEGGPIDASVALARRVAKKVRGKARQLRRHVLRVLPMPRVPAPILPPPALQAHQLDT